MLKQNGRVGSGASMLLPSKAVVVISGQSSHVGEPVQAIERAAHGYVSETTPALAYEHDREGAIVRADSPVSARIVRHQHAQHPADPRYLQGPLRSAVGASRRHGCLRLVLMTTDSQSVAPESRHISVVSLSDRNVHSTPASTVRAFTPRFSPRVPAFELWWLRSSAISPGPPRFTPRRRRSGS